MLAPADSPPSAGEETGLFVDSYATSIENHVHLIYTVASAQPFRRHAAALAATPNMQVGVVSMSSIHGRKMGGVYVIHGRKMGVWHL
jgi:hypothetical protein